APRLGPWWRDLGDAAERLAGHLDRARPQLAGRQVAIVAFGLGGLAARLALQREGRAAEGGWLVTLGTPHGGTRALPLLGLGALRSDVRPGSVRLRALRSAPLPAAIEAVAIASPDDALLLPPEQARWADACNVSVEGSGHLGLLVSGRVYELIAENLASD